jgi:hypothetical protein
MAGLGVLDAGHLGGDERRVHLVDHPLTADAHSAQR